MRKIVVPFAAALLAASAQAAPPREESPAPRELVETQGSGNSDAVIEEAIAAANAYPLGTLENPIRVEGPEGQQAYLARLRCADGSIPKIGAKTNGGVGTYGTIVDSVPVDCGTAAPGRVTLVVDLYHAEHVETRPPPGFTAQR